MGSVNKVILIGRLGQDLDRTETQTGSVYYRFSMATEHRSRGKDTTVSTDWHDLVIWGKNGDALAEFVGKGDQLYIEGRLSQWKNKENRKVTNVVVETFCLLGNKPNPKAETEEPQGDGVPF
jgi:single-strand DNA-binding protein